MNVAAEQAPLDAEGFILAGGASSRFGSEKALARLSTQAGGVPLIAHTVGLVRAAGLGVRIAGARTSALAAYAPVIADALPGAGPLAGIHSALQVAGSEYALFLPVDMPLMPAALLTLLLRRAALTRASVSCLRANGMLQPFPVVLHTSVLAAVAAELTRTASCFRLWQSFPDLDAPGVESLAQTGQLSAGPIPPALWFRSANTPGDLAELGRWLALRAASRTLEA